MLIFVRSHEMVGLFTGIITTAIGGWLLYSAIKNKRSKPQIWRLPEDHSGREGIDRLLSLVVGAGFVIVGLLMFVASLSQLSG